MTAAIIGISIGLVLIGIAGFILWVLLQPAPCSRCAPELLNNAWKDGLCPLCHWSDNKESIAARVNAAFDLREQAEVDLMRARGDETITPENLTSIAREIEWEREP